MTTNVSGFIPTAANTAVNSILNYNSPSTGFTFAQLNTNSTTITASADPKTLHVKGDVCVEGGDITIDGMSVKTLLEGVSARLAILIPDPNKLEKYEALRLAYERFKFLEALLGAEDGD